MTCKFHNNINKDEWKSAQRRHKHCMLAVVRSQKKICPAAGPFPGARDGQNLISWRWSLPLPTNQVCWESMHAISSYCGNRPTHTQTTTHRQYRLQYTAQQLARSVTITVMATPKLCYNSDALPATQSTYMLTTNKNKCSSFCMPLYQMHKHTYRLVTKSMGYNEPSRLSWLRYTWQAESVF